VQHYRLIMCLTERYDVIKSSQLCSDSQPAGKDESFKKENIK
jgi:hypothetical protein